MGKGKGAGSPIWFICAACRKQRRIGGRIRLTRNKRPYKPPRYSALGTRSTLVSREYVCACGHRGWSNHIDLEQLERTKNDE